MSTAVMHLLEQFKRLSAVEKREAVEAIFRESAAAVQQSPVRRKTVAEVAGKYCSAPEDAGEDHNDGFVKAVMESKGRRWS